MKKTIVHIIDDLGRGGAETMLVKVLENLDEYNNIIVTLYPRNEFGTILKCDRYYCLHLSSPLFIPFAARSLKKIIVANGANMVHSHLFWSTVVARLGTPKKIPLLTTIHAFVASSIEYRPWHMKLIEKFTFMLHKSTIIAVAKGALEEYFKFIKVKPWKSIALYTFVDENVFNQVSEKKTVKENTTFKLVTVGNLKPQKNHTFLLRSFRQLKQQNISLDIYGKGPLEKELQKMIDEHGLPVSLKGQVQNIQQVLQQYDLFVMSSLYEGFALSVLEAMALGVPLLLTDIPSFIEQCADTAFYYKLNDEKMFIEKLMELKNNSEQLIPLGNAARIRVLENFTLAHHLEQLRKIYSGTLY